MLWLQPRDRCSRWLSYTGLMERPVTLCWPRTGDDDRRHRRHGVDCQQGTTALCREGSKMPERTAGIGFSPEHATSGVRRVTGWCVLTSLLRTSVRWWHSVWTAICPRGAGQDNCSNKLGWQPACGLRSARFDTSVSAAEYESDAVPRSMIARSQRHETSVWGHCHCGLHCRTSVLLGFSYSRLALIHKDTSSTQAEILSCKLTVSRRWQNL